MTYVDVYESIHHKIIICYIELDVYRIFLTYFFIYSAKPCLLIIHRSSFAFCDVIEGKNKHNSST